MNVEIVTNGIKISDLVCFNRIALLHDVSNFQNFLKARWLEDSVLHFSVWFLGTVNTQPCPLTAIVLQSEHEDFHNCVWLCHNSQCVNTQSDGISDPPALNGFCVCSTASMKMLFQHLPFS